jgi:hypothetical protein
MIFNQLWAGFSGIIDGSPNEIQTGWMIGMLIYDKKGLRRFMVSRDVRG